MQAKVLQIVIDLHAKKHKRRGPSSSASFHNFPRRSPTQKKTRVLLPTRSSSPVEDNYYHNPHPRILVWLGLSIIVGDKEFDTQHENQQDIGLDTEIQSSSQEEKIKVRNLVNQVLKCNHPAEANTCQDKGGVTSLWIRPVLTSMLVDGVKR